MPAPVRDPAAPTSTAAPRVGPVLLVGAVAGLLVGALVTNASTALVELDESGSLGAACEHAEATIAGAPSGLLVGLVAAACFVLLHRRRSPGLALLAGAAGALVALVVVTTLLWPLATTVLPVFVCAY